MACSQEYLMNDSLSTHVGVNTDNLWDILPVKAQNVFSSVGIHHRQRGISAAGVNGSIPKVSLSTQVWCEYSSILLIFRHPFHGRSHSEHPSSKKYTRKMDLIIEPAMRDIIHLNEHPVHSSHYQMGSNIVDEVVLMSVWQHNGDDSYRDGAFCKMIRTFFFLTRNT